MAAKRKPAATKTQALTVYRAPPAQQAPIVRIQTPRAISPSKAKGGKGKRPSRRGSGATSAGSLQKVAMGVGIGGAAMGFIEKNFGDKIPEVPIVGRKGTIAIGAYLLSKNGVGGQIMRDVCIAAAAIAGYELGKDGKISGDDY